MVNTQNKSNSFLPIALGLSVNALKGNPDHFVGDKAIDPDLQKEIFERDDHSCRYCGFKSEKFQRINARNGNWSNLDPKNLATSCIFCHQCFYLDQVATMRSGVLVWMPEITQAALNHLLRNIYVARITQGPMADYARKSLETLMSRREEAKKRIHTDDPAILALTLGDYVPLGHYKRRHKKLDGIRLLPLERRQIREGDLEFNQFPQILAYWRSKKGPFGAYTPDSWIGDYSALMNKSA